jgi:hypothetical protein
MDTTGEEQGATLVDALQELHRVAGAPSVRRIAAHCPSASHATVHSTLRGQTYPSWVVAAEIITALGGNPKDYRRLYLADRPDTRVIAPVARSGAAGDLIAAITANTEALDRLTATVQGLRVNSNPAYPNLPPGALR